MADAGTVYIPERDARYEAWVKQNPSGYVINAHKAAAYPMKWHRADCTYIQGGPRSVEGDYIKACSLNPATLATWAHTRREPLEYCQVCQNKWLKERR